MIFVPGIDYGPRKGTLGWNIHMAEGGDGTVTWLTRRTHETYNEWVDRVNGVSANFVIKSTGEAVQMVPWGHAAGNLNPRDRSTDKAYYGRRYLLEVLPEPYWRDPNAYTISAELCGFRVNGPTPAQVKTLIGLIEESKALFPGIRGAFGHADQTDTKGCPGVAPTMRAFWDAVGHGLFNEEPKSDVSIATSGLVLVSHHSVRLPAGTKVYDQAAPGSEVIYTVGSAPEEVPYFGKAGDYKAVRVNPGDGSRIAYTASQATVYDDPPPAPLPEPVTVSWTISTNGSLVSEGSKTFP